MRWCCWWLRLPRCSACWFRPRPLIVTMFGGVGTLWGPVIGAFALVPLSEFLHARLGNIIPGIQGVVYGVAIIAVTLLAPEGVFWKVKDLLQRRRAAQPDRSGPEPVVTALPALESAPRSSTGDGESILEVRGLAKAFGGLQALRDIGMTVRRGEILGIIGPNGAGKTTLFNVLNGFIAPDNGALTFEGRSLLGLEPFEICAAGIGRTFQVVRPFRRMTVLQNVIVGAYVNTASDEEALECAQSALLRVGLGGKTEIAATRRNLGRAGRQRNRRSPDPGA
jgi:ABC-type transport system involved in cytochrome bd biosynthesis fused ATPase/permease subunit